MGRCSHDARVAVCDDALVHLEPVVGNEVAKSAVVAQADGSHLPGPAAAVELE